MAKINRYAVLRNTATLNAYRAYNQKLMRPLQRLGLLGVPLLAVVTPIFITLIHTKHLLWAIAMEAVGYSVFFIVFIVILLKVLRERRTHPFQLDALDHPRRRGAT